MLGRVTGAAVVTRAPVTPAEPRTFLLDRLAPHELPGRLVFVAELPKNHLGKVVNAGVGRTDKELAQSGDGMTEELRVRLAGMIADASGGVISPDEVLAGRHTLSALGLTSLARISLIDTIEDVFGLEIDLSGDLPSFEDVDTLVAALK